MNKSEKILKYAIGILFLLLYMLVATISAICSIDFFNLSHSQTMSICLAIAFELGAMCSLCAGVFMKSNRTLSFGLFTLLTLFQMMGNVFHSYTNLLPNYIEWINLFGLEELEEIAQKRIVSIVSGAILPIVALGFIKCFVDYNDKSESHLNDKSDTSTETETPPEKAVIDEIKAEEKQPEKKPENHSVKKEVTPAAPIKSQPKVEQKQKQETHPQPKVEPKKQEIEEPKAEHKFVDLDPSTMI